MVLEVVLNANLMNVVLQTQHFLQESIAYHGRSVSQNAWNVQKGITLMIHLVHVCDVMNTHAVLDTLTIIQLLLVVSNVVRME